MIPCCIPSYREDSFETVLSARSARLAGFFPVFVLEQNDKPLNKQVRQHIEEDGGVIVQTDFPRGKNLNGINCLTGLHQSYLRIMDRCGTSHVFKMDADTLALSMRMTKIAADGDKDLFGWNSPMRSLYGASYLVSRELSQDIVDHIKRWKGIPGHDNARVEEDVALMWMAALTRPENVLVSEYNAKGGFGAFWAFQDPDSHFPVYRDRFEMVNFGNRRDVNGNTVSKVEAYLTMESFLKYHERCLQTPSSSGLRLVV